MEKETSLKEWVGIRNRSTIGSEEYQRAKDNIEDIRGDTNNVQVGNLTNFIKAYKTETDRSIRNSYMLSVVAIGVAVIALLIQITDFFLKYCVFGY